MRHRVPGLILVFALALASAAKAQGSLMQSSQLWAGSAYVAPVHTPTVNATTGAQTYWLEGLVIGGVVGGVLGGVVFNGLCDQGDNCTGATIAGVFVGAAVLAVPGAFIGKLFKKHPAGPAPATP